MIISTPIDPRQYRRVGIGAIALLIAFTPAGYPVTETFRANGTPTQPIGAPLTMRKIFSDANQMPLIELVGADLPAEVAPGQRITARLYWHALRPLQAGWHIALKMQDITHTIDWANSDNAVPGGFSTATWPVDRYVVDTHQFTVSPDAPPYVDDLTVTIYDDRGLHLQADSPIIVPIRVLSASCPPSPDTTTVRYGEVLTLTGDTLTRSADHATLDLYWRVNVVPPTDLALFVHIMTGQTLITAADSAPIDSYPSYNWQTGQCLHRQLILTLPITADRVLIGFYRRSDGARLPTISAAPLEADGLVISLSSRGRGGE